MISRGGLLRSESYEGQGATLPFDSTADFYVQLFGWTLETMEDGYQAFQLMADP